ncbi:MAG: glycosyltransferase family 4 protein, partial [Acidobacteriota bacterium]|nr:glycosyltransferase family 4 protein [Acidobacteriota bacterium]
HTLHLCYFGMREPLVQTQVIPYLLEILKDDIKVTLLTFEPNFRDEWTPRQIEAERKNLAAKGIDWYCLPYHKTPSVPATLWDIFCGARFAYKMIRREKVDVLHTRSHVPALMAAIAKRLSSRKVKFIFDIRGFFPEEYVDAGNWKKNGLLFRAVKRVEKWLLREADGFVVLTEKARRILFPESENNGFDKRQRPVEVIPCCVDLKRFEQVNDASSRDAIRRELNVPNRFVIAYVGSLGTWYLADEMADFLATAKETDASVFALILTQSDANLFRERLLEKGFGESDFYIAKVSPSQLPQSLNASDAALSFIKPCYSKLSSSPTKIAEYLACGLPIVTNGGVGDVDDFILTDNVGVVINDFSRDSYFAGFNKIKELMNNKDLTERCRKSAENRFDLVKVGGAKYRNLYRKLLKD